MRREARMLVQIAVPAFAERVLYHVGYVGYVIIIARLGIKTESVVKI